MRLTGRRAPTRLTGLRWPTGARLGLRGTVAIVGALGFLALAASPAAATTGLKWGSRLLVDPPDGMHTIRGVSCPTSKLCAAVDGSGNVIVSAHPTGGTSAWKRKNIDTHPILNGISCRPSLCVAVDSDGYAVVSTNPTSQSSTWTPALVDSGSSLEGISCPSSKLCVAVDNAGQVVSSTDPTGGATQWTPTTVDSGKVIKAISCASTSFCVAVDNKGNSLSSTHPASGNWTLHTGIDSTNDLASVSCPTASFCAAVDQTGTGGNLLTSTSPASDKAWKVQLVDGNFNTPFGIACPAPSLCVAVDDNHKVFTSTHPTKGKSAWTKQNIDFRWSLLNISCTAKGLCVTGDQGGNVVVGRLLRPNTEITHAAINKAKHSAKFSFKALGLASGFQCALTKQGAKPKFSPCSSPKTYKKLKRGSYKFLVRAFNLAGTDKTPASKKFTL